jgi:nickel superoxide dismutase
MKLITAIFRKLPATTVYAHCDIPCGIYSPDPARMAAAAAKRMVKKISELDDSPDGRNNFVRMVQIKEREAQRCKEELLILWTDYFKPEHLGKFPQLHDIFWQATKQCSAVKRTLSEEEASKLVKMVEEIAEMYRQAESSK